MDPSNSCQLVVIGIQGKRNIILVQKRCTIDELYAEVIRVCAPGVSAEELRLVYGGSELERGRGKTIIDHDIPAMAQIFMVIRLRGGGKETLPMPVTAQQLSSPALIYGKDIITFDDGLVIKMSCGHTIGATTLLDYCTSLSSGGGHRFPCPSCGVDWNYGVVRKSLRSQGLDVLELDSIVMENYFRNASGFQKCPGSCGLWIYRDSTELENGSRMICPVCQHKSCWLCLGLWLTANSFHCGNSSCKMGMDPRLRYLQTQPTKMIGQVSGCPSVRACPRCSAILEHKEACKHMTCKMCGLQFCFVCLKLYDTVNDRWQCGSYSSACPVTPVQSSLPRK